MQKGAFITFEGPEGSGKTTQIAAVKAYLLERGFDVVVTREPGGTPTGDKIRSILLDNGSGRLEAETEMFLMLAQRTEHLRKVIAPAVAEGKIVLCDRYFDSSAAYQGYGRGIGAERVREVHQNFLSDFLPDCTVLLYIAPERGLERAKHGGAKQLDRMESEQLSFHKRVCDGYLKMAGDEPERFITIEADGSPEEISQKILGQLLERIPKLSEHK